MVFKAFNDTKYLKEMGFIKVLVKTLIIVIRGNNHCHLRITVEFITSWFLNVHCVELKMIEFKFNVRHLVGDQVISI